MRAMDFSFPKIQIEPMSGGLTRLPVTAILIGIIKSPSLTPSFSASERAASSASSCVFPKMPETNSFAASRISFVFAASSFLGII